MTQPADSGNGAEGVPEVPGPQRLEARPHDVVALRLRGIGKEYPGVRALSSVDLDIRAGEVHGLVGENGAGKSTLLKIIAGAHQPTEGTIELFGESVEFNDPLSARKHGITAVYQELTVIPTLSAVANVFLGQAKRLGPLQDRAGERKRFQELCETMDVRINPNAQARSLSIADQQTLEIMRGIESAARVLVLDEPTASLAIHERRALYKTIKSLSVHGVTIVLISHDIEEVLQLSDTVTVLRDGMKVETRAASGWTSHALIQAMLGEDVSLQASHRRKPGAEILRVRDLRVPGYLSGIHLTVRAGEIVGIAGLVGSGRTELLRALAGLDAQASGSLWIDGELGELPRGPGAALRLGIALAPEDRKADGLVLGLPAYDNVNLTRLTSVARWRSVLVRSREIQYAEELGKRVKLQEGAIRRTTRLLSGGNQQKLVLAKWIDPRLKVLLVDEPARGIDVGAKAEVFSLLDDLASRGLGIVMVSSELEEVAENSDRVFVIGGGEVIRELEGGEISQAAIMATLFGSEGQ